MVGRASKLVLRDARSADGDQFVRPVQTPEVPRAAARVRNTIVNELSTLSHKSTRPDASERLASPAAAFWVIIAVSLTIHVVCLILGQTVMVDWRWEHHPVHASMEAAGSLIAFFVAVLLSLEQQRLGTSFNVWISGALVGMGILDGLHAVVHAGQQFVWLHSIATFVGGVLFSLVWVPASTQPRFAGYWPWAVFVSTLALGLGSLAWPQFTPAMLIELSDGTRVFSPTAVALNMGGGLLLLAAGLRLIRTYFQHRNPDDLLFCLHCVLFGAAALMLQQSQLWDVTWWGSHAIRFLAYAVALWFIILALISEQRVIRGLRRQLEADNRTLTRDVIQREDQVTELSGNLADRNRQLEDVNQTLQRTIEKLQAADRSTRQIIDSAPCGMLSIDEFGIIMLANTALEEMFGYAPEELVGRPVETLIEERLRADHIILRNQYITAPERRVMGLNRSLKGVRRDGTTVPVEIGLSPIGRESNRMVLATIVDISERLTAEKDIRRTEKRLALAASGTADGLFNVTLATGEIWYGSRFHELLGFDTEDEIPQRLELWEERIHPDELEDVRQALKTCLQESSSCDLEHRLKTKDGNYRWFRLRASLALAEDGTPEHLSGSIRDNTDAVEYRNALEISNTELQQFAYVASHDLQEPLRKITSFCNILEDEYADQLDGEARQFMQYVVDGAQRMQTLIRDLLAFSRVKSEAQPLSETSLQEAVDIALVNLESIIEERGAEITHDELPVVIADSRQLPQLLQNLIGNGIKYSSEQTPTVHIGIRDDLDNYVVSIEDNGIGIAEEYQERIFGIFKRLHARNEYEGTGIGLAICKRIVERWGEKIWVESQQGAGSVFAFTLRKPGIDHVD